MKEPMVHCASFPSLHTCVSKTRAHICMPQRSILANGKSKFHTFFDAFSSGAHIPSARVCHCILHVRCK